MTDYDELFDATIPTETVFADKSALDPLAESAEIISRDVQERKLATILNDIREGYLPTTVSIYGPPGTGKTTTTRRLCREFAARNGNFGVEYINLKECRTLFSVANEILFELAGEKKQAYEGLDGVFEAIWNALEDYPEWTVLLLDEIDHIQHDSNHDPNEFFYRLLRGEGKLKRGLNLSIWLLSNELLEVDLRLDSRVQSAMSGERVFFSPYGGSDLKQILTPRLEEAFRSGALPEEVRSYGIHKTATRWGDVRKALTLFRHAGETANERGLAVLTTECIDANLDATEKAETVEKLISLPAQNFRVLAAITAFTTAEGNIRQPVTTERVHDAYGETVSDTDRLSRRAIRNAVTDLETMGLVETWIESRGREGRVKLLETAFDPTLVDEARDRLIDHST